MLFLLAAPSLSKICKENVLVLERSWEGTLVLHEDWNLNSGPGKAIVLVEGGAQVVVLYGACDASPHNIQTLLCCFSLKCLEQIALT